MSAHLITWNPDRWPWKDLEDEVAKVQSGKRVKFTWSTGNTKNITPPARLFILKQGVGQHGIFGVGNATSDVYQDGHWDPDRNAAGDEANYIDGVWESLINPLKDEVLSEDILMSRMGNTYWTPPASGFPVRENNVDELEQLWREHLNSTQIGRYPDEAGTTGEYQEGAVSRVLVNRYERDPDARADCIAHYGVRCQVCTLDFEERFGEIGQGFIHVHHLKLLSELGENYVVSGMRDLRPVCPNCHAMLHTSNPPLTIKQLKAILNRQR